jgi:hypothetical protein
MLQPGYSPRFSPSQVEVPASILAFGKTGELVWAGNTLPMANKL